MPLLPLALCSCRFRPNYQHKTQLDLPTPHGGIQRALRVSVQPLGDSVATDNSATDILPPSQSQILQHAFERIFKASTLTFGTTMYKFTTTDVQVLKSNCNEDFASLIEIMIHRTSTPASVVALVSRSRVQLMQQKQPKLQLQLQPPKSASKTSWRCLTFTDASECDEEVRKVLYSIRYLVSCSCAVPELVEKKARALLEAKQTEAVAQLAPDAPNSPPLQLPAVALRHQRKQQQLTAGSVSRLVASPRRRGSPHQ
jgi:hypothetical protein